MKSPKMQVDIRHLSILLFYHLASQKGCGELLRQDIRLLGERKHHLVQPLGGNISVSLGYNHGIYSAYLWLMPFTEVLPDYAQPLLIISSLKEGQKTLCRIRYEHIDNIKVGYPSLIATHDQPTIESMRIVIDIKKWLDNSVEYVDTFSGLKSYKEYPAFDLEAIEHSILSFQPRFVFNDLLLRSVKTYIREVVTNSDYSFGNTPPKYELTFLPKATTESVLKKIAL